MRQSRKDTFIAYKIPMKSSCEESNVYAIIRMRAELVAQETLEQLNYNRQEVQKKVRMSREQKVKLDWGQTRNEEDLLEVFSPEAVEDIMEMERKKELSDQENRTENKVALVNKMKEMRRKGEESRFYFENGKKSLITVEKALPLINKISGEKPVVDMDEFEAQKRVDVQETIKCEID